MASLPYTPAFVDVDYNDPSNVEIYVYNQNHGLFRTKQKIDQNNLYIIVDKLTNKINNPILLTNALSLFTPGNIIEMHPQLAFLMSLHHTVGYGKLNGLREYLIMAMPHYNGVFIDNKIDKSDLCVDKHIKNQAKMAYFVAVHYTVAYIKNKSYILSQLSLPHTYEQSLNDGTIKKTTISFAEQLFNIHRTLQIGIVNSYMQEIVSMYNSTNFLEIEPVNAMVESVLTVERKHLASKCMNYIHHTIMPKSFEKSIILNANTLRVLTQIEAIPTMRGSEGGGSRRGSRRGSGGGGSRRGSRRGSRQTKATLRKRGSKRALTR
jgi:hypothetical protein